MCGRYASSRKPEMLVEEFEVVTPVAQELRPDYNVAPTKLVYAVVNRAEGRSLSVMKWGLVPSWAKDPSIGSRMINARVETVAEKPAYKRAFASRRCILPADGYYEWYTEDGPKPRKQPFFIRPASGESLAMAGIYEVWRDPSKSEDDPTSLVVTTSVITTSATDDVGRIHDRMPQIITKDNWQQWLDPEMKDPQVALSLLTPAVAGGLEAYPVSTDVNAVRNNGPHLVEPLPFTDSDSSQPSLL